MHCLSVAIFQLSYFRLPKLGGGVLGGWLAPQFLSVFLDMFFCNYLVTLLIKVNVASNFSVTLLSIVIWGGVSTEVISRIYCLPDKWFEDEREYISSGNDYAGFGWLHLWSFEFFYIVDINCYCNVIIAKKIHFWVMMVNWFCSFSFKITNDVDYSVIHYATRRPMRIETEICLTNIFTSLPPAYVQKILLFQPMRFYIGHLWRWVHVLQNYSKC